MTLDDRLSLQYREDSKLNPKSERPSIGCEKTHNHILHLAASLQNKLLLYLRPLHVKEFCIIVVA
jgi:hypothetical protein